MWLNHFKYDGFGDFPLLQKSQILDDFGVDFGVVLGALGVTFGPLGVILGAFGRSKVDSKKR